MSNRSFIGFTLIRCVAALSLFEGSAAPQTQSKVVAAVSTPAPAGGIYQSFNSVSMNGGGKIAFLAGLTGTSNAGIFVVDRSTTSAVALAGTSGTEAPNFLFVGAPSITADGDVVFTADTGLFQSRGKRIVPVVKNGDVLGGVGTLTPGSFTVDSDNKIAFSAAIADGVSTSGIFRTTGGRVETVVRDHTPAPTGGTFDALNGFAINERRQVAFEAIMSGGSADFGVFRRDGEETKVVFASNQSAPGGGSFSDFSDPVMNARGEVAVVGAPLQNTTSNFGLFLSDGNKSEAIALDGHTAPAGGSYHLGVFAPFLLNDQGQLLFNVGLTGGTARSGLFRSKNDQVETVALEGSTAPGTAGTFAAFQDMKMMNDGRFAFVAQLTQGVGGVGVSNNTGIWVGTSGKDLRLLARTGDTVGGTPVCISVGPDQFDLSERSVAWISRCPRSPGTAIILSVFDNQGHN